MEVHSVVLNWNNYEDTAACLNSLQEISYEDHYLWVVDNGSTDDSGTLLEAEFVNETNISYLSTGENLGYAGGMNAGIDAALDAGADAVWLLNNDTVITDSTVLHTLVGAFDKHKTLGGISPTIINPETGKVQFSGVSGGVFIPPSYFAKRRRRFKSEISDSDLNYGSSYSSVLLRSKAIREVGNIPERYFMYVEDIEHGYRLEKAGYQMGTHTETNIGHRSHGSSSPHGPLPSYYKSRNWLLFFRGCRPNPYLRFLGRYIYFITTRFLHRLLINRQAAVGILRGAIDGVIGRDGKGPWP
ncbi:glycosyltransferase family 2 protein [Haloarcula marismortui]|uniref:Glycosyltransferase family 2 protein n=2 Tax=Haloarcula marismortui ATCC 33800 TaxID=662476 RepID=A0A8T8KNP1_9EURY|nr:glycosyltransferase family 2 protein [Haloarcula sinaiiensis]QUJ73133.1 glycosyltransferase family 2 protein [Haloarcula sinaiiensis ATCC 33800]